MRHLALPPAVPLFLAARADLQLHLSSRASAAAASAKLDAGSAVLKFYQLDTVLTHTAFHDEPLNRPLVRQKCFWRNVPPQTPLENVEVFTQISAHREILVPLWIHPIHKPTARRNGVRLIAINEQHYKQE